MKTLLALLALPFIVGCGILGIGSQGQLPEVWAVPVVQVRWESPLTAAEPKLGDIHEFLVDMNARIYDLTDGQVRIAKFELYGSNQKANTTPGIGNLSHEKVDDKYGKSFIGLPNAPGYFFFTMPSSKIERIYCVGVAAHEWLHAYIGLYDEYAKTGGSSNCPKEWAKRMETDSCVMDSSWRTELCRHGSALHNPDTFQSEKHGMSCYEWLKKAVHDAGKGEIVLPDKFYCGPDNPPDPVIENKF